MHVLIMPGHEARSSGRLPSPHRAGGPGDDPDDAGLVPALRRRGLHARWLSWDDPGPPRPTW
ncbi:hypothetical protein I548_0986 [Mycobacterium intracellulare]|nr:hypothetical protein I548_0986 [Mycobacterium intracellulare]